MLKVLVAEIGSETTVVNAFGNLNTENPLLLGQGTFPTTLLEGDIGVGIKNAVADLEKDIGPLSSLVDIPFYAVCSLPSENSISMVKTPDYLNGEIFSASEAIMKAVQLIHKEVGDVLVLNVEAESTSVYSAVSRSMPLIKHAVEEDLSVFGNASALVKLIGEKKIIAHHGQNWEKFLKERPTMPEELALRAELAAAALDLAVKRHGGRSFNFQWIVGTGMALTELPNGLQILMESVTGIEDNYLEEEIAILIDRDCIMASLGVLTTNFRQGAWQLLRESLGVEN